MLRPLTLVCCGLLSALPMGVAAGGEVDAVFGEAFAEIPGRAGFVFAEPAEGGPRVLFARDEEERFAIGSSFKLFILGALAAELNADRRQLEDVMRLRADWVGPPHSELAGWPVGSPVTLHTLALKMISISDNTATDHLLHLLGRENVERQLAMMGHAHPEWNRPLLSTREMVLLRDTRTGLPGREYLKLDEPGKRLFLADRVGGPADYETLDFDTAAFDLAEWYATPLDMARAMAWLQRHTGEGDAAHPLRAILAVDPKLSHDAAIWPYVGFKGGSEDQLLCGNWLLQHRSGRWYTFHVFCNSPEKALDQEAMIHAIEEVFAAVQEAIDLNP